MLSHTLHARVCVGVAILSLAAASAVASPYFAISTAPQWQSAMGDGRVKPMLDIQWPDYMAQWSTHLEEGDCYPVNAFLPPQLYVWEGGGGGGGMEKDGLYMIWGTGGPLAEGSYSSAWKYEYGLDPNLTNCIITLSVNAPQFDQSGNQINAVSFGLEGAGGIPPALGPVRSWQWGCGPGQPIQWGVQTWITINTNMVGVAAASPVASGFASNPAFVLANVLNMIVDENAVWLGGTPAPPAMGLPGGLWNYWYFLEVDPFGQVEACCFSDGTCANLPANACTNAGGTPQGAGTVCAGDLDSDGTDDTCEVEACCLPGGGCGNMTVGQCQAQSGIPMGAGSVCLGDLNSNGVDDLCEQQGEELDFGDAPEDALAYSIGIMGQFPTCLAGSAGVIQHTNFGAWFGPLVDFEPDGNAGNCPPAGFPPYDMDECFQDGDAGLIVPDSFTIQGGVEVPCVAGQTTSLGQICTMATWGGNVDINVRNTMPGGAVGYLNVLMDWDQNGMWGGGSTCPAGAAPEWVVVNFPIPNGYVGPVSGVLPSPPPSFLIGPNAGYVWSRFTITELPIQVTDWDGSGSFEDGETEDYLLKVDPEQQHDDLDFGDAPEDALAYSTGIMGQFPTCLAGPAGVIQHTNFGAWFGPLVDFEPDGNAGNCPPTGFPPYDMDECFQDGDAGLIVPDSFTIQGGVEVPCVAGKVNPLGQACATAVWGGNVDISVRNNMPGGAVGYLNVLMDWDQNGMWGGGSTCPAGAAPEWVVVNFPIPNGYVGPVSGVIPSPPPNFLIGPNPGYVWSRFTITERPIQVTDWDGSGNFEDGETEDYLLKVDHPTQEELDFGDAPDSVQVPRYPTLLANNGARHGPGSPILGPNPGGLKDFEMDGQPTANADGDDNNPPGADDEDGVTFMTPLWPGGMAQIAVSVDSNCLLDAWFDWNADGDWLDAGEKIYTAQGLAAGAQVLAFPVPATAIAGPTYARFRVHTNPGGVAETGFIPYGEVEDYIVNIVEEPTADLGDAPDSTNNFGLMMTAYPAVPANFPTVYQGGLFPAGPRHVMPMALAWLGNNVSLENEADTGSDQDLINNIDPPPDAKDQDGMDDGVLGMPLMLPHCRRTTFQYQVNLPVAPQPVPLYVNVWFDWNRDGDWDDIMACGPNAAPEWAVQNQVLNGLPAGLTTVTTPQFRPWHPGGPGEVLPIWMRITLSEQQWVNPGTPGSGGCGPSGAAAAYQYGETEDYLFVPQVPQPYVISRLLFYHNASSWYGPDPIATDKVALIHGTADFSPTILNHSGYSKGLNGVYVDIQYCPGVPTLADFVFKYGNATGPGGISTAAPAPTFTLMPGAGVGGSDRCRFIWPDYPATPSGSFAGRIPNRNWLLVATLATANTGLPAMGPPPGWVPPPSTADYFFYGICSYDAGQGNSAVSMQVTTSDWNNMYPNRVLPPNHVPITNVWDVTKDSYVTTSDWNNAYTWRTNNPGQGLKVLVVP